MKLVHNWETIPRARFESHFSGQKFTLRKGLKKCLTKVQDHCGLHCYTNCRECLKPPSLLRDDQRPFETRFPAQRWCVAVDGRHHLLSSRSPSILVHTPVLKTLPKSWGQLSIWHSPKGSYSNLDWVVSFPGKTLALQKPWPSTTLENPRKSRK